MRHRSDLECLATLDAATIQRVCSSTDDARRALERAVDEYLEMDALADELLADGARDEADYHRQEAAAWRATVTVLREVVTMSSSAPARNSARRSRAGEVA